MSRGTFGKKKLRVHIRNSEYKREQSHAHTHTRLYVCVCVFVYIRRDDVYAQKLLVTYSGRGEKVANIDRLAIYRTTPAAPSLYRRCHESSVYWTARIKLFVLSSAVTAKRR